MLPFRPLRKEGSSKMKNQDRTIQIGSVSGASSVKRLLAEGGIRARLVKTDVGRDGCLWGVRIRDEDLFEATRRLRYAGVSYVLR